MNYPDDVDNQPRSTRKLTICECLECKSEQRVSQDQRQRHLVRDKRAAANGKHIHPPQAKMAQTSGEKAQTSMIQGAAHHDNSIMPTHPTALQLPIPDTRELYEKHTIDLLRHSAYAPLTVTSVHSMFAALRPVPAQENPDEGAGDSDPGVPDTIYNGDWEAPAEGSDKSEEGMKAGVDLQMRWMQGNWIWYLGTSLLYARGAF